MPSPRGKDPHAAVLVAEPVRPLPQRLPGRSPAQRVLPCGRALYPGQVTLLAAVYGGAARVGLTRAATSLFGFAGPTTLSSLHALASPVFPLVIWPVGAVDE
jgi:hypothetical protein